MIGPPGSGKTASLRGDPAARTFDVRTLAFVERRRCVAEVKVERRKDMAVPSGLAALSFRAPASRPDVLLNGTQSQGFNASRTPCCDRHTIVAIDHLEYRFDDPKFRDQLLPALEDLLFRQERHVWVACTCDPIDRLCEVAVAGQNGSGKGDGNGSAGTNGDGAIDIDRWTRVFQWFRKEVICIGPAEIDAAAEPYCRALWTACSIDEKLALRHLADEGIVNPRNQQVVLQLIRKGLVVRRDGLRLMDETFGQFVAGAVPADTVAAWEREGVRTPWASVQTALLTCVVAFGGFLILTQQQLVGAWFGVVPALLPTVMVPAVPTVISLLASRVSKSQHVA
jgi:hypothetical protein